MRSKTEKILYSVNFASYLLHYLRMKEATQRLSAWKHLSLSFLTFISKPVLIVRTNIFLGHVLFYVVAFNKRLEQHTLPHMNMPFPYVLE